MADIKKRWVNKRFNKWTFEYQVYDENTTFNGMDVVKDRIPNGGLSLRNIYHAGYRMAFDLRTNAIWIYPGKNAIKEGFKAKKLVLGIPDFEQQPITQGGNDYNPVYFDKGGKGVPTVGSASGIPYNFKTFTNSIEGEMLVKWKTKTRVFGDNSDYLYITQKIVFTKYSAYPAHEPGGALQAARIHPMVRIYYGQYDDGYLDKLRIDYRMHFSLDQAPLFVKASDPILGRRKLEGHRRNHAGLFKDEESVGANTPGLSAEQIVFESAEKPIIAELIGQALLNGRNRTAKGTYTWDNIHYWGAGGNIYASTPGAFHAVHLHWRWGMSLQYGTDIVAPKFAGKPQFRGTLSEGGPLIDHRITIQSIEFALITRVSLPDSGSYSDQSTENFADYFKASEKEPPERVPNSPMVYPRDINADSYYGGDDLVTFYSATVKNHSQSTYSSLDGSEPSSIEGELRGNIFLHGLFFAHENEKFSQLAEIGIPPELIGVGSHDEYYIRPVLETINKKLKDWERNPTSK